MTAHEYKDEAKAIANFVVVSEAAFFLGHLVGLLCEKCLLIFFSLNAQLSLLKACTVGITP